MVKNQIRMLAADLNIGETVDEVCPFCNAKHEKSFSITRTEVGLLYNCYRVSCKQHGFISSIPGTQLDKPAKAFKVKHFTRPLAPVGDKLLKYLHMKYELTEEEIVSNGIKYDYTELRLYMPIFDYLGHHVGAVSKRLSKTRGSGTKVIAYWENECPKVHFPLTHITEGPLVVVEDTISAIRVARHFRSCALLGTNLSQDVVNHLAKISQDVAFALDADTWMHSTPLALRYKQKYGLFFRNFISVKLSKDPKDTTDEELRSVLLNAIREETS